MELEPKVGVMQFRNLPIAKSQTLDLLVDARLPKLHYCWILASGDFLVVTDVGRT